MAAQFEERGIGDPPCQNLGTKGSTVVEVWPSAWEGVRLGEFIFICAPGFTPRRPVDVWLTFPDGRVEQRLANDFIEDTYDKTNVVAHLHWFTVPGHPLGRYQITASEGGKKASGEFVLVPADRETITVFPDDLVSTATGPPGKTFNIGFFGFRPNARIDFLIFHQPGRAGTYTFVTGLSTQADGAGQTVYRLATSRGDATGRYCVLLPHQVPEAEFGFRRPSLQHLLRGLVRADGLICRPHRGLAARPVRPAAWSAPGCFISMPWPEGNLPMRWSPACSPEGRR